jgi:Zn-dependent protease
MLLGEPATSQADLNFRLAGFPIRVTPWFWIGSVLLGWSASNNGDPQLLLAWVLAVFTSILIHELGHAVAFRYFGISAHVVLYQFGGLAVPNQAFGRSRTRSDNRFGEILISFAGPLAQFLAATALAVILWASGYGVPLAGFVGTWLDLPSEPVLHPIHAYIFLAYFLDVSIYWALLNLLPIYPLDGGQIAREFFLLSGSRDALKYSLILSLLAAIGMAVRGFTSDNFYFGVLFGMLAYSSYIALQPFYGGGNTYRDW